MMIKFVVPGMLMHLAVIITVLYPETPRIYADTAHHFIDTKAIFRPSQFNNGKGLQNHHFIVAHQGNAAPLALFNTLVSDSALYEALIAIGATPGNNLTLDSWNKRFSKKSNEPDKKVTGSPITISIIFRDSAYSADEVLRDLNNKPMDFRFGGNFAFIHAWQSGCVVCLESCPGGTIGNSAYTIRDLTKGIPQFATKTPLPFSEGDTVVVRFRVME